MRTITKTILALNGVLLLFLVLWLLVGGGGRGYFGGGAATEVDGILLLFVVAFNLAFLVAVLVLLPTPGLGASPGKAQAAAQEVLNQEVFLSEAKFRNALRTWSLWALIVNGVLVLFVGLWLLINSDRRGYFQSNATSVDMILLFVLSLLNLAYMGIALLRYSRPGRT